MAGARNFFLIVALCFLAPISRAAAPTDDELLGTWFRVYEKCNTPLEQLPDFEAGGGDALVGRRMILQLESDRYVAIGMDSLRCGKRQEEFERPADAPSTMDCVGRTENSGMFSRDETIFHFFATQKATVDNNWGTTFRDYQYQLRGRVLELSPEIATFNCGPGTRLFIYFIRYPGS